MANIFDLLKKPLSEVVGNKFAGNKFLPKKEVAAPLQKSVMPDPVKLNPLQKGIKTVANIARELPAQITKKDSELKTGLRSGLLATVSMAKSFDQVFYDTIGAKKLAAQFKSEAAEDRELANILASKGTQVNDVRKLSEKVQDPQWFYKSLGQSVPATLASLGVAIPLAIAGAPAVVAGAAAAGVGGGLTFGSAYQDAIEKGVDDNQAKKVATYTAIGSGVLESIPGFRIAKKILGEGATKAVQSSFARNIIDSVISIFKQGAVEGGTESLQTIYENAWKKTYDENQDLFAGVGESALFGSILGAGTDVGVQGIGGAMSVQDLLKKPIKEMVPNAPDVSAPVVDVKSILSKPIQETISATPPPKEQTKDVVEDTVDEQVKAISPELEPLAAEARKYESAEEFVKAKTSLFHGTNQSFETPDVDKGVIGNFGRGFYLTPNRENALQYANKMVSESKNGASIVQEYLLKDSANLIDMSRSEFNDVVKKFKGDYVKAVNYLKKEGYDGIDTGLDEVVIFNKDALLTKSQLTDFYNQVKGSPSNRFNKETALSRIISGPKMSRDQAVKEIFRDIQEENLKIVFEDKLIDKTASGMYEPAIKPWARDIIRLYEKGGLVQAATVFEEYGHLMFNRLLSATEKKEALDIARQNITLADRAKLRLSGYTKEEEILEEYLVKKYAKERASAEGYDHPLKKAFDIIDRAIKKLIDTYKKIKAKIDKFVEEAGGGQGGYVRNPFAGSDPEELKTNIELLEQVINDNPAKGLSKYVAKSGQFEGTLPEFDFSSNSKFAREGDNGIIQEMGFSDLQEARDGYENYLSQKKRLAELKAEYKTIESDPEESVQTDEISGDVTKEDLDLQYARLNKHRAIPFLKYVNKRTGKLPAIIEGFEGVYGKEMNKLLEKNNMIELSEAQDLVDEYYKVQDEFVKMQQDFLNLDEKGNQIDSIIVGQDGEMQSVSKIMEDLYDKKGKKIGAQSIEEIIDSSDIPVGKKVGALDYFRTPEKVLKEVGLADEGKLIRKKYEDYLEELPKNIDKITEWSKRVPGKKANQDIFMYLDGTLVDGEGFPRKLYGEELAVANEIRAWFAQWAERLDLPLDKRLSHYITHIFEQDFIEKEFDADLAKIIADKVPGEVYDPFLQERLGAKGFKRDTWAALDAYVKRGTRKVHMDVALSRLKIAADKLPIETFNYVKDYADRINLRPSERDTLIDNTIKKFFGYKLGQRPVAKITRNLRKAVYRAMLGLNFGSALRNLTQGVNTYSKLGEVYTVKGYYDLLTKGTKELEEQGILMNSFIEDRSISAAKKTWENIDKGLFLFFEMAEKINRGSAYYGAKAKALSKGKTEEQAIQYAKQLVRDTQFNFGSVDTPVGLQSDMVKLITQFMGYSLKQTEFLAGMVKNREISGLVRYTTAMLVLMLTLGDILGIKDWKDWFPKFRLGIPPGLRPFWNTFLTAVGAPDKFGNPRKWEDVAIEFLTTFLPGGVQAKKSYEGFTSALAGESTDKGGRKQYNLESDPLSVAMTTLLGKNSTKEAQEYYDKKGNKDTKPKLKIGGNNKNPTLEKKLPKLPKVDKKLPTAKKKLPKLPKLKKLPKIED
jgi:hypothetical protein